MNRIIAPALLALSSLSAAAQDGGTGLSYSGEAKLEYIDASSHLFVFSGDLGATWRSGGLIGFDASMETLNFDNGEHFTNFWAAAVLSMGASEVAIGAPRPVMDALGVAPRFSTSRGLDLEMSFLNGPVAGLVSADDNGMSPGLTYTYVSGGLAFGAGYHRQNDNDVDVLQGIMRYDDGVTSYFVSAEKAIATGDDLTILQLGALHDADRLDAGATLSKIRASETNYSLRVYGSYDILSSLTVRGDLLMIENTHDIYSLSATYATGSGIFVEGGSTVQHGSEKVYDIGLGFKF